MELVTKHALYNTEVIDQSRPASDDEDYTSCKDNEEEKKNVCQGLDRVQKAPANFDKL